MQLDLKLGASFDPLPTLKAGATDVVITAEHDSSWPDDPTLTADPLFRYQVVTLLHRDHPLVPALSAARRFPRSNRDNLPSRGCRLICMHAFWTLLVSCPPSVNRRINDDDCQWVRGGVGLAAYRWAVLQPELTVVPLGANGLWSDLYAVRRKNDMTTDHINEFTFSPSGNVLVPLKVFAMYLTMAK